MVSGDSSSSEGEEGGSGSGVVLSPHGDPACVTGELAIAAPSLGLSQSLLNREHTKTYYAGMPQLAGSRCARQLAAGRVRVCLPGGATCVQTTRVPV